MQPSSSQIRAQQSAGKPRMLHWRKKPTSLPRPFIDRQGRITHFACAMLGGGAPAISFLNTYHDGLGARPLDLAGGSAAGYSAVHGEVQRLASIDPGDRQ